MADDLIADVTETSPDAPGEAAAAEPKRRAPAKKAAAKRPAAKRPAKRAATPSAVLSEGPIEEVAGEVADSSAEPAASAGVLADGAVDPGAAADADGAVGVENVEKKPAKKAVAKPAKKAAAKKTAAKRASTKKVAAVQPEEPEQALFGELASVEPSAELNAEASAPAPAAPGVLFQAPEAPEKSAAPRRRSRTAAARAAEAPEVLEVTEPDGEEETDADLDGGRDGDTATGAEAGLDEGMVSGAEADAAVVEEADDPWAAYESGVTTGSEPVSGSDEAGSDRDSQQDDAQDDQQDDSRSLEGADQDSADDADDHTQDGEEDGEEDDDSAPARRRRRRGGRRRRKPGSGGGSADHAGEAAADEEDSTDQDASGTDDPADPAHPSGKSDRDDAETGEGASSRRRRRRRRTGDSGADGDDPENTVVRVRDSRSLDQQITSIAGSTRLEAKKQRRRDGREAGRRRAPIVSEAEFLARRESVERVMVVRQRDDLTQIGVIEDKVLVEHYVARDSQTSLIGNIYLGRVQNVLPSMEAAFVDIGKGRNAVLYAGEVNWAALGHKDGQPRKIESVLSSGQHVLVQVTKDPVGHKGARLSSQISLAGRFLVYVPDGTTSGISRKLPDTERHRLKHLLKEIVPDTAGVIVRTAAEGASEEELTRDVERLKARWEDIEAKAAAKSAQPQLLYGEPDLTLKVVRDLFTEDFAKLVVQGDEAWETVKNYVDHVAPDLGERLEKHETSGVDEQGVPFTRPDLFSLYRVDEQIAKGLDRKVWLPSGGSLVIDRTEAMTVVDVNTGKFTGSGGNLEETVTKNNLEAAEEIVRQLRLRDIGGIIVVDFIDMVLESNRDLVLRRMVECLGRDRTRHQVAEVTSLGLVQMTRKRIGTGLVEAFSENCTHCQGRGIVVHDHPVETSGAPSVLPDEPSGRGRRRRGGRGRDGGDLPAGNSPKPAIPTPKDIAAMARHDREERDLAAAVDATGTGATSEETDVAEVTVAAPEHADVLVDVSGGAEVAEPLVETPVAAAAEGAEDGVAVEIAEAVTPEASAFPDPAVEADLDLPATIAGDTADPDTDSAAESDAPTDGSPAPLVVTRTRGRRGASTAVISAGPAAVVEIAHDVTSSAEPAGAEPAGVQDSAPAPVVVTRGRRGASRDVVHTREGADPATD